ncbi:hypothetical protein M231_01905 [Tremella mesenterica]|uniref:CsbD-like domain-containing protein n=1 Tax=Tremella mesenterica TaxID=5217 RepID=A0A4Q1BSB6_TREME|nr:hypothetical protein M231_01905 [Tremella mesenterica]
MSTEEDQHPRQPSQLSGQMKIVQGQIYNVTSSVLPQTYSEQWKESGDRLIQEGETEVQKAKVDMKVESTIDSVGGKIKSMTGYLTNDQNKQIQGNVEAEKAQWKYKQASSDSPLSIPIPSEEGLKGKLESVQGIILGDQEKQKEGNIRAEKSAWKDGV